MTSVIGVVSYPGSNGDQDALFALQDGIGAPARIVDHRESSLDGLAAIVVPGGFSYGDHLRCGAIARFAPFTAALRRFADGGGPVLGICNGFQILTEAHLLPGALLRNRTLRFHCNWTHVRVERTTTAWTSMVDDGAVLALPVAHGDGSYYADPVTLASLEARGQVVARYCDAGGDVSDMTNPNGSVHGIAGVSNQAGNVVGLMPHPERAADSLLGGDDGLHILRACLDFVAVPA